jgi:RNA polymerase sigma-70 factor (ECF subfamily)
MDERDAIARAQRGDIAGLEALVRTYQVRAVRTAYLIVRDRPLAEDIVQQAFIRAYERIGQLQARRPFAPWFLRSVANDALKALERGRHTLSLEAMEEGRAALADLAPGPDQAVENAERADAVWDAVQRLPAEQRAAIVLRYYAGLSDAEIAEQTSTPPPSVRWRLHAARKRLRGWLSGWGTL